MFQVIPPCGGILNGGRKSLHLSTVSSHTPLRGYSCHLAGRHRRPHSFKSYPLAGVFLLIVGRLFILICFKSYPLAGVFPGVYGWEEVIICFKSYPLAGVFSVEEPVERGKYLFQVIPPCGGILSLRTANKIALRVSSHTPLRGYSAFARPSPLRIEEFQVIPPCGGIPATSYSVRRICGFQVIPPCGGIRFYNWCMCCPLCFKSYPLAGVFLGGTFGR